MTGAGITVSDMERAAPGGTLRATFTVQLGGVTVFGVRLVEGKNGLFVSWPSRKPKDSDRWLDVVKVSDAINGRVLEAAKAAYGTSGPAPEPVDDLPF